MFEYLIKVLESLKCFKHLFSLLLIIILWYFASYGYLAYKKILSISGWRFIRLNNEFVSSGPESWIINILCEWSQICDQSGLFSFVFSFTTYQS